MDKKNLIINISISFFVSIFILIIFGFYFSKESKNENIKDNSRQNVSGQIGNYQLTEPNKTLSLQGSILEIKGDEYIINTNYEKKISFYVDSDTEYTASFSFTQAEIDALSYTTSTSTSNNKLLIKKVNLKIGDRVEVIFNPSTTKNIIIAKTIKLI